MSGCIRVFMVTNVCFPRTKKIQLVNSNLNLIEISVVRNLENIHNRKIDIQADLMSLQFITYVYAICTKGNEIRQEMFTFARNTQNL